MRVLTWNLRHGGSDKARIALAVTEIDADVAVLTEFQSGRGKGDLLEELRACGWRHFLNDSPPPRTNGVLIASKSEVQLGHVEGPVLLAHRWAHFRVASCSIEFVGIYQNSSPPNHAPGAKTTLAQKQAYWDQILLAARRLRELPAVLIGDLNTGKHLVDEVGATFRCSASFEELTEIGWFDAFRMLHGDKRAYTWWSNRGGFRLDHAFVSPPLTARVRRAEYITSTRSCTLVHARPRPLPQGLLPALSDHAALILELD